MSVKTVAFPRTYTTSYSPCEPDFKITFYEKWTAEMLQGGSQFWLHIGSFPWLAFCCFYYYNQYSMAYYYWYSMVCLEDPTPLFDCKLKCLCSALGETVSSCPPVNRLTHPFQGLAIPLEMFGKMEDPFTWLPHCLSLSVLPFDFSSSLFLSLWSIKESGIQTPIRWLFWGASLPSSQPASSSIKVSSLPQHLVSGIHWSLL